MSMNIYTHRMRCSRKHVVSYPTGYWIRFLCLCEPKFRTESVNGWHWNTFNKLERFTVKGVDIFPPLVHSWLLLSIINIYEYSVHPWFINFMKYTFFKRLRAFLRNSIDNKREKICSPFDSVFLQFMERVPHVDYPLPPPQVWVRWTTVLLYYEHFTSHIVEILISRKVWSQRSMGMSKHGKSSITWIGIRSYYVINNDFLVLFYVLTEGGRRK